MAFVAENVTSSGENFATFKVDASSDHYPLSYIVWGNDSGTQNVTSTAQPLPIQPITSSATPTFVTNNSATQLYVQADSNNPVHVTSDTATGVFISDIASAATLFTQPVQIRHSSAAGGYDATNSAIRVSLVSGATDTTVTITNDSADPIGVTNDSTNPIFVRGVGSSTVPVSGTVTVSNPTDTTVTVTGYVAASSTVTITNDSADPIGVTNNSANAVYVRGLTDSTVSVSGTVTVQQQQTDTVSIGSIANATGDTQMGDGIGGLQTFSQVTDTTGELYGVTSSGARLYGWHLFNPSTAVDYYVKIHADDSAGITPGTTNAQFQVAVPFGGGNNQMFDQGIQMSSGISVNVGTGTALNDTANNSVAMIITLYYKDLSGT